MIKTLIICDNCGKEESEGKTFKKAREFVDLEIFYNCVKGSDWARVGILNGDYCRECYAKGMLELANKILKKYSKPQ